MVVTGRTSTGSSRIENPGLALQGQLRLQVQGENAETQMAG